MSMRTRAGDYATSVAGALDVSKRAPKQKVKLLYEFDDAGSGGLTDWEAGDGAELLESCFWKRCGELREDGLIEFNGLQRKSRSGVHRNVSVITDRGRAELRALRVRGLIP